MKSIVITVALIIVAGLTFPTQSLKSAIATANASTPLVTTASYKAPVLETAPHGAWFNEMVVAHGAWFNEMTESLPPVD